ncbi:MAG: hypothetical protein HY725_14025 [Candidatus Rokubacteria bacterium]|nr:hypothetical protein [Candidatus Rokubacteria bacterium]
MEIKTADQLVDVDLEARWARRRASRQTDVLQRVLWAFVERGGPVGVEDVEPAFPDWSRETVREHLIGLDEDDLIVIEDGRIAIAYPFSAAPTPFVVRLAGGGERYACCAIDALGVAPMLGQRVQVRARCHHCDAPLEFAVAPDGPDAASREVMVWVGKRSEGARRVSTSL